MNVGELKIGLKGAQDLLTAFDAHFKDLGADEQVFADAFALAEIVDPALIPFAVAAPVFEFALAWIVANNRSATPGALSPISSGRKGSDPWME